MYWSTWTNPKRSSATSSLGALGGKVVLSSPNFFRAIGFRDYHRACAVWATARNWKRLREKRAQMRVQPDVVRFDRMQPSLRNPHPVTTRSWQRMPPRNFSSTRGLRSAARGMHRSYVARLIDFLLNLGRGATSVSTRSRAKRCASGCIVRGSTEQCSPSCLIRPALHGLS